MLCIVLVEVVLCCCAQGERAVTQLLKDVDPLQTAVVLTLRRQRPRRELSPDYTCTRNSILEAWRARRLAADVSDGLTPSRLRLASAFPLLAASINPRAAPEPLQIKTRVSSSGSVHPSREIQIASQIRDQRVMGRQPCCEKVGLKKGPWTADEDQKLVTFLLSNGHCCWRLVPKLAGA